MIVSLILIVFCAAILWCKRQKSKHPLPPEFPGALPIIGHTHMLITDARGLWKMLKRVCDFNVKSGGVTYGQFGFDIYYGVGDPEDAMTVANTCLQKHFLYKSAHPWLGQGLFTASGALWKHHRKVLNPAFSIPVINGFFDIFNCYSRRMVKEMEEHVGQGPYNHVRVLRDIILRVSCITAFGDADDKDDNFVRNYVDTVDEICHVLLNRLKKAWYHNDFIYSLSSLKKKEDKLTNYLNAISDEVINRKRKELENGTNVNRPDLLGPNFRSFLDLVLEMTADGSLTDEEIRHELNTAVAAAFETTSQQLVFTLTLLGSYPEVQEKMYMEVMEVIGPERDVERDDISKLVYTEAVIKESLRLIPVAPLLPRYVGKDVKLKNYTLRAGSQVFFMPIALHSTNVWGEDPSSFRPERWLDKSKLPQFNNSFAAFSLGKRSCIGKTYAMISMKVILAHLVRNLRWTGDYTKMELIIDITLRSEEGHEIVLESRNVNNNKGETVQNFKNFPISETFSRNMESQDLYR